MNKLLATLLASLFAVSTAFAASHAGAPMPATPAAPAATGGAATPATPSPSADKGAAMKEDKAAAKTAKKSTKASKKTAKKSSQEHQEDRRDQVLIRPRLPIEMPASRGHFSFVVDQIPLMNRLIHAFAALLLASLVIPAAAQEPQTNLPRVKLSAGMHLIDAQVAHTPGQREIGLMFRKEMPQHEGMLFVFEQPSEQCFWMKNTLLPLTAAFIADDGTLVNLADMKPQDAGFALLGQTGALCAGDEPGLVRAQGHQARVQAQRRAFQGALNTDIAVNKKPASWPVFLVARAAHQPKFFSAKPQFTSLSRKVSTYFGRRLR